jgi:hypothetical protein
MKIKYSSGPSAFLRRGSIMTDVADNATVRREREVTVLVDRHPVEVPRETTAGGVLVAAGLDPARRRLVMVKGKHQTPYPDPSTPLKVHEGEVFVTISTGPTPVS